MPLLLRVVRIAARDQEIRPRRGDVAALKTHGVLRPTVERRVLARVVLVVEPVVLPAHARMPLVREAALENAIRVQMLAVAPDAASVAVGDAVGLVDVLITLGAKEVPSLAVFGDVRPFVGERFAVAVLAHLLRVVAVGVVAVPQRAGEFPTVALPREVRAGVDAEDAVVCRVVRRVDVRVVGVGERDIGLDRQALAIKGADAARLVGHAPAAMVPILGRLLREASHRNRHHRHKGTEKFSAHCSFLVERARSTSAHCPA